MMMEQKFSDFSQKPPNFGYKVKLWYIFLACSSLNLQTEKKNKLHAKILVHANYAIFISIMQNKSHTTHY
jgi:hypothetical protein